MNNNFKIDYENRLISALGNGHNASYVYDPFGRRISKTVDGITTNFIYDGDRIIEERDITDTLIKRFIYGSGIDELLSDFRPLTSDGANTYTYDVENRLLTAHFAKARRFTQYKKCKQVTRQIFR